ncbi:MAG TPA: PilN domain-containing protein [Longimicrobium sp.]|nr:PilN domain-containing protein [Longimicrobium sp.]
MIEINLLPSGAARRPAASRAARSVPLSGAGADPRVIALGLAAVLILGLTAFGWWRTGAQQAELTAQLERERADSVRLARTIELMKTIEQRRDTIERKIAVIRAVDGRRYVWPHLMDEVSRAVPPYTWLTRVAGIEEQAPPPAAAAAPPAGDSAKGAAPAAPPPVPRGPGFNVEGNAATTQALTRFMKNLEASPMIRDVALVTSEQTATEGREYLKFTLEARWEQPDSTLVESVPVLPVQ